MARLRVSVISPLGFMVLSLIQDTSRRPNARTAPTGNTTATQRGLAQTRRSARVVTPDDVDEDLSEEEEQENSISADGEPDGKANNKKGLATEVRVLWLDCS